MARASKKPKFEEFNNLDNCFGEWSNNKTKLSEFVNFNDHLILEIGAGKAALSLQLAHDNPKLNYIAVDKKSDRLNRPARAATEAELKNIAFLQADARTLTRYDLTGAVNEIWVTFPDPYPKKGQAKHRLVHKDFLILYKNLLTDGGVVHFKTDDNKLFDYFREVASQFKGLNIQEIKEDIPFEAEMSELNIHTHYEQVWRKMGRKIKYARFNF